MERGGVFTQAPLAAVAGAASVEEVAAFTHAPAQLKRDPAQLKRDSLGSHKGSASGPVIAIVVVTLSTAFLVGVSWRSLRRPRSHGFFRFVAFEAILCLVVLNAPHWFDRAGTPRQVVSWLLLTASFFLAVHSFYVLRRLGEPAPPSPGSPLFRFENTAVLISVGPYRYIRHPLYAAGMLLAWGAALKTLSLLAVGLAVIATGFLLATAKAEEVENLVRFGTQYRQYMVRTRLFIPFVL
jgi:protein-S-isoprenylcysteine O-methyltransferase Ste14